MRCCTQNGVRGGTSNCSSSYGTQEIEDILVLKNNKGTEDNRVRKLDYLNTNIQTVHERFINEEDITLFSPMMCLDCMMRLAQTSLMLCIKNMKKIPSPKRKVFRTRTF